MKITIISVGKLKEKYLIKGINEYAKRLGAYCTFNMIEVNDEPAPEHLSVANEQKVKAIEGERILERIASRDYVIALDLNGKQMTSEAFAADIEDKMIHGQSHITFVIGGSLGLSPAVIQRSQAQIAFGKMTYPHQLMRLILTEQIYRVFRIIRGEPYHK